jgi:hypothetical protein
VWYFDGSILSCSIIFQEMTELYLISHCGYNNGLVEGFVLGLIIIILALVFIEIGEINNIINDGNSSDEKELKKE